MIKNIFNREIICDDPCFFPHVSLILDVVALSRDDIRGCSFQELQQITFTPEVVKMICENYPKILDQVVEYQRHRWPNRIP